MFLSSKRSTTVEILRDAQDNKREEPIGDSLWWDVIEVIIGKTPKVTTDYGHVVGLRGMGHGIILIEKNALTGEIRKGGLENMLKR